MRTNEQENTETLMRSQLSDSASRAMSVMPSMIPESPGSDFFKYRIDGSDIIDEIIHQLRGDVYNATKNRYENKFSPWANELGINKIVYVIYACGVNKNTFLGNLTKDEILYKCCSIKKKLAMLIFKKSHDFGIEKEMRSLLIVSVVNTIHSALSRSEEGKESEQISVAAQRQEVFHHAAEQQKRDSLISRFPFLGGRR